MLTDRLPHGAGLDLVESGPHETVEQQFAAVLTREIPVPAFLNASRTAPVLTDDRPVNEYYLWRRILRDGWTLFFSHESGRFIRRQWNRSSKD